MQVVDNGCLELIFSIIRDRVWGFGLTLVSLVVWGFEVDFWRWIWWLVYIGFSGTHR